MKKCFIVLTAVTLVTVLNACAYDPVNYEKNRMLENAQHNKITG